LLEPRAGRLSTSRTLRVDIVGAEFNVCVALARLGVSVGFCTKVGADPFGERIRRRMEQLDIDTRGLVVAQDRPTGLMLREPSSGRARSIHYYRKGSAASALDEEDCRSALLACRAFVVSGITMALGAGPSRAAIAGARTARQTGAEVVFDPNLRAKARRPARDPRRPVSDALADDDPQPGP